MPTKTLSKNKKRVRVISLPVNVCDLESVIQKVALLIKEKKGGYLCFSTVHMVMEAYDDREYQAKVNAADFVVSDGMPIVWMQRLQGAKCARRVRANDAMIALCKFAQDNELKVGFYGSSSEVIRAIQQRAGKDFPTLQIVYAHSPPFRPLTKDEDEIICNEINTASPDILFVGLGCPRQENWMAAHRGKITPVMLGVGASFDFFAGNVKETPQWLGGLGLEWLYRFTQEPRRLWKRYLILNPRFLWLAMLQLMGLKKIEMS